MTQLMRLLMVDGKSALKIKGIFMNENLTTKPNNNRFIIILVFFITLALMIIAGCLIYNSYNNYIEKQQKEADLITYNEIELAKNTIYENKKVSKLLNDIDSNILWDYFVTEEGEQIVQATGSISHENITDYLKANTNYISQKFDKYNIDEIKELNFRIQFKKYFYSLNHYTVEYSEYLIKDEKLLITPISAYSSIIFENMSNYLSSSKEIELAKNTIYEQGIASIILNSIDSNSQWNYFISDTGQKVVEATGSIPSDDILDYLNSNKELVDRSFKDYDLEEITELKFRIQFEKNLDDFVTKESPYNNYFIGYTEYTVKDKNSKETNITAYSKTILGNMTNYLSSKW